MKGKVKGAAAVRQWLTLTENALHTHSHRLNHINVYPVPDSDTGANMLATVRACRRAADSTQDEDLGVILAEAGSQAMNEACGNSGTLLAVFISGLAEPLTGEQRLTVGALASGLERASLRAWSALSHPVEGTMLTVLDAARDSVLSSAASAAEPDSRAAVEEAMGPLLGAAREALIRTEHQLAPLARARVVDSGGLGLLIVFAALAATVRGSDVDHSLMEGLSGWDDQPETSTATASAECLPAAGAVTGVELMCTARLDPLGAASLRHRLDELGESVIITPIGSQADADGALRWRIHVHTEDPEGTTAEVRAAGALESSTASPLAGASAAHQE